MGLSNLVNDRKPQQSKPRREPVHKLTNLQLHNSEPESNVWAPGNLRLNSAPLVVEDVVVLSSGFGLFLLALVEVVDSHLLQA